ncbi:MAG: DUF423 domain-containing protein [Bacteroidia bacterium]|nr:DUF423 domain-containing protein [Bacteroidia bacterium]NND51228.1 DUF423 domain-containing protein [Flavobacteriaceae bacterium]
MDRKVMISGSIFGLIAIILGAFAAHGLEKLIDAASVDSFQTGVRYQMYHALLLLFIGSTDKISKKTKGILLILLILGLLFFSGSIYGLSTNTLTSFDFKNIGFITPLGGLLLVISWLLLLVEFLKIKKY